MIRLEYKSLAPKEIIDYYLSIIKDEKVGFKIKFWIARHDKDLLDLIHNYDNGQSVGDNYDKDKELVNYDIEFQKRDENKEK